MTAGARYDLKLLAIQQTFLLSIDTLVQRLWFSAY
jgi:hypothetical protein